MKKNSILLLLASLLMFPAFATEKNDGAPLGMNLGGFPSWEQPVFVDIFKQARSWISQVQGGGWETGGPLDLDENGWIKSLASTNHFAETPLLDGVKCIPYGDYVVLYEGEGTISFGMNSVTVKSSTPGRIVVNYKEGSTGGIWLQIRSVNASNYIKNIRVLMPGTEETYLTEPFYKPFVDVWGQYKVIRFMDWLSTNNNTTTTWAQRTTPQKHTQASGRGIAWEYLIEFSNLIECDPWICIPHLADDNYIRECAKLLKRDLNPNAKIYLEYSNEVWNWQFAQATYANNESTRLGLGSYQRFFVRRSMDIFKIFEEEFGGADRFVRVLAWQTGGGIKSMMDYEYKVINSEGMSSLEGKKGSDFSDAHATAPYFGGSLGGQLAWVNSHTVDDILTACESALQDVMNTVDQQVKEAAAYGKIFLAYEAGQHLAGTGGNENNDDMTNKFIAANRHTRMKELYLNYMNRWKMSGAQTMCIFSSIGGLSKWGSWSIIENYCQDISETPKYAAVREFSEENTPAWWLLPPPPPPPVGEVVINFDCSTLSGTLNMARNYVTTNQLDTLHFDTSDAGKVFDGGTNKQATIYGGFIHTDRTAVGAKPTITKNNGFSLYMDAGNVLPQKPEQYSEGTGLFMWRADQFLQPNPKGFSKLFLHIRSYTDGKARFVVKNNGKYYLSEYAMTTTGEFEFMEFDDSKMPTKRWLEVDLSDGDFGIAKFSSSTLSGYQALKLDNVTEIGFWITSHRPIYGHTLSFMSFKAYASVVAPEPGNHAALTALIAESESLLSGIVDDGLIGNANGQYTALAKSVFETAISNARQVDENEDALQMQIDAAVLALETAKSTFLASKIVIDYAPLAAIISECEALYAATEAGGGVGQYPIEARNTFKAAIDAANAIYVKPNLTAAAVSAAVTDLEAARSAYFATVTPPSADYYILLKEAIDAANTLYNGTEAGAGNGQYPAGVRNTFKTAIDAAKALYTLLGLTETEVAEAVADLNAAKLTYSQSVISVDYVPLEEAIEAAETLYNGTEAGAGNGQYPTAVRNTFKTAIDEAKAIYDSPNLTETEVVEAVADLGTAKQIYSQSVISVDYTSLEEAIEAAETLYNGTEEGVGNGQYPTAVRNTFKAAIDEAKSLYVLPNLAEAEVIVAVFGLNVAIEEYRKAVIVIGICSVSYAQVNVYPNPVKDRLYLDAEAAPLSVRLFSTTGVLLLEAESVSEVDMSSMPQGVYLLQVVLSGESLMFNVFKE